MHVVHHLYIFLFHWKGYCCMYPLFFLFFFFVFFFILHVLVMLSMDMNHDSGPIQIEDKGLSLSLSVCDNSSSTRYHHKYHV